MEGKPMSAQEEMHRVGSASPKRNVDRTPTFVDWRDTAVCWFEWAASGFIGLLFGGFTSCYWDWSVWVSIVFGAAVTVAVHWVMPRIAKRLI